MCFQMNFITAGELWIQQVVIIYVINFGADRFSLETPAYTQFTFFSFMLFLLLLYDDGKLVKINTEHLDVLFIT